MTHYYVWMNCFCFWRGKIWVYSQGLFLILYSRDHFWNTSGNLIGYWELNLGHSIFEANSLLMVLLFQHLCKFLSVILHAWNSNAHISNGRNYRLLHSRVLRRRYSNVCIEFKRDLSRNSVLKQWQLRLLGKVFKTLSKYRSSSFSSHLL